MKYGVFLKESGEGCDYTIGCGQTFRVLKSTTLEDATIEARTEIFDTTYISNYDRRTLQQAFLVEIKEDLTAFCGLATKQKEQDRDAEEKAQKRAQIEKLRKELGE